MLHFCLRNSKRGTNYIVEPHVKFSENSYRIADDVARQRTNRNQTLKFAYLKNRFLFTLSSTAE